MRQVAVLLLVAMATLASGTDTSAVNVIGPTEFEIPAADPTKQVEILPPVTLIIASDMTPETNGATSIRAKLVSVSVGTTARPEYGKAFQFGSFAAGKKGDLRELSIKV